MFSSHLIRSITMKILIFLFFGMYFHDARVASRSFQLDGNALADSELEVRKDFRLRPESEANVIWTRVKSNPVHGVHTDHERTKSGNEEKSLGQLSPEVQKLRANEGFEERKTFSEKVQSWNENGEPLETDPAFSENVVGKDFMELNGNQSTIANDTDSNQLSNGDVASDIGNLSSSILPELELGNFSDTVVFNFLNFTQDSILEALNENVSSTESAEFDETSVSEEGETAFFQEVVTSGFELLVDSQTTKTFILTELLSSQSVLISELDNENTTLFEDEEYSTLEIVNFSFNEDQEIDSTLLSEESTHVPQNTERQIEELESENIKVNMSDLNSTGTEHTKNTQTLEPKCPEPGWCFFWFLSQDTCAENNHCLGSRICCKSGCSKTCIDV